MVLLGRSLPSSSQQQEFLMAACRGHRQRTRLQQQQQLLQSSDKRRHGRSPKQQQSHSKQRVSACRCRTLCVTSHSYWTSAAFKLAGGCRWHWGPST
jgi:hypothetical protein